MSEKLISQPITFGDHVWIMPAHDIFSQSEDPAEDT